MVDPAKDGERVVRTVGCVDVTDYVDLIVDTAHVDEVQTALAAFLAENADAYDRINYCNIPEASPFAGKLSTRRWPLRVLPSKTSCKKSVPSSSYRIAGMGIWIGWTKNSATKFAESCAAPKAKQ